MYPFIYFYVGTFKQFRSECAKNPGLDFTGRSLFADRESRRHFRFHVAHDNNLNMFITYSIASQLQPGDATNTALVGQGCPK